MDHTEQESENHSVESEDSMETNKSERETNPLRESDDSEPLSEMKHEPNESKYELRNLKQDQEEPIAQVMRERDVQEKGMDSMFASVWVKVELDDNEEPEGDDSTDVNYEPKTRSAERKKKQQDRKEVQKKPRKVPTKVLNCPQCDYTTTYTSALNTHMVGHSSEKKFKCNECNYRSKYQNALTRHIKIQHRNDNSPSTVSDKIYYCDQCEYTTNFPWNLKAHKRKHGSKQFKCDRCPFETAYRHNYLKHKKTHDPKENTMTMYKCDKCTFVTKHEGHITRHLAQIHNEITDMSQKCDKCDFSTRVRWRLNVHKVKSKVDSVLQCSHCEFQSYYKCEMKHHKIVHYDIMYAYKHGPRDSGGFNAECDSVKDTSGEYMTESHNSEIEPTTGLHISAKEHMQTNYSSDYSEIDKYLEIDHQEESNASRKGQQNEYLVDPDCVEWKDIKVLETNDKERPFQCLSCEYASRYKAAVKRHFQRHHTGSKNRPYECVNCGFSTKTKDKIALHNRRSRSETTISCNMCEYTTLYKCQFVAHQKKEHYENKCTQCEYSSRRKYELEKHYTVVHMGNGLKCRFCEYVAARKESILTHETIHTGVKPYKCEYCEYTGVKSCLLFKHVRRHHPHVMRNVVVVSDSKIETLKQKFVIETQDAERPYQCPCCDFSSQCKATAKGHYLKFHASNKTSHQCENCGFASKSEARIDLHVKNSKSEITIHCDACQFTTLYRCELDKHMKKQHCENKCNLCDFTTKRKTELEKHCMVVHKGNKKCSYCDYVATKRETILIHEAIHTGIKPFECQYCDYIGAKRGLLIQHLRRVHNDYSKSVTVVSDSKIEALKQQFVDSEDVKGSNP